MNPSTPSTAGTATAWRWVRLVVVVVATAACALVFATVAWFWFAGARRGWVPAAGGLGALGVLGGRLGVTGRWPRARRTATVVLAATGIVGGAALAHAAPPTAGRLHHVAAEVARPGWQLLDEQESGSTSCFDYCLEVVHVYASPLGLDGTGASLQPYLDAHDCRSNGLPPPGAPRSLGWTCGHGSDAPVRIGVESRSGTVVVEVHAG